MYIYTCYFTSNLNMANPIRVYGLDFCIWVIFPTAEVMGGVQSSIEMHIHRHGFSSVIVCMLMWCCACVTAVHGTRQEEVIDHRLTDREWAEEWKHLDNVCVTRCLVFLLSFIHKAESIIVANSDEGKNKLYQINAVRMSFGCWSKVI